MSLFYCEKRTRSNVEKVRRKVTGGEEREECEKKGREDVRGKIECVTQSFHSSIEKN